MNLPKIKFKPISIQENIDLVKWMYYEDDESLDIHNLIIKYFPQLAKIDKNLSSEEVDKIIEDVVNKEYQKNYDKIKKEIKRYNNLWESINDKYFSMLSNFLKIDWPKNLNPILCTIGLMPIFPRHLDTFSFSISADVEDWRLVEVCAHEALHFLWFLKWQEMYPKTPRNEFESPSLIWKYSEMVTDPILNNKPFSGLFDFEEKGYDSFYQIYDEDKLVMDNLRSIFCEEITVEEKIEKGFSYIKKIFESKGKEK